MRAVDGRVCLWIIYATAAAISADLSKVLSSIDTCVDAPQKKPNPLVSYDIELWRQQLQGGLSVTACWEEH